jgi:hypothetical protein
LEPRQRPIVRLQLIGGRILIFLIVHAERTIGFRRRFRWFASWLFLRSRFSSRNAQAHQHPDRYLDD